MGDFVITRRSRLAVATAIAVMAASTQLASAESQIARGKYLVIIAGCSDCHTPGSLMGKPDTARFLGGSDVSFVIPGLGAFPGRNLTPDKETGLGTWSTKQIITAMTTGVRPDGRMLAPIMPWEALSKLSKSDARAIAAYLKSLKPVKNAVPGPFGPSETPTTFVMTILPSNVYAGLPKPGAPPPK
jgi:mono/diheme cytochrome c family protein